jgi:hypothetical protein
MKDPNSVLVLQVAEMGIYAFVTCTERKNVTRDRDYIIFDVHDRVTENVYVDKPQLLITGIVSGALYDLSRFVNKLRERNPQLVVVCFSSFEDIPGDFDRTISKQRSDCWSNVAQAIKDFEEGRLRRPVPATT